MSVACNRLHIGTLKGTLFFRVSLIGKRLEYRRLDVGTICGGVIPACEEIHRLPDVSPFRIMFRASENPIRGHVFLLVHVKRPVLSRKPCKLENHVGCQLHEIDATAKRGAVLCAHVPAYIGGVNGLRHDFRAEFDRVANGFAFDCLFHRVSGEVLRGNSA